jgi:cytochrome P450 family 9
MINTKLFYAQNRIIGMTGVGSKTLIIKDPELINKVTIKYFDNFVNHLDQSNGDKFINKTLFFLRDQKWREMRSTLSPIYTSSKMKFMFGLLVECIDEFTKIYEAKTKANEGEIEIETLDVFSRITADGISSTTLGFKGDCVANKDSKIFEIVEAMQADFTSFNFILSFITPKMFEIFNFKVFRQSVRDFFNKNFSSEIQRRREEKFFRPDIIQLLLQAKEGHLKMDTNDSDEFSYTETKVKKIHTFTDEDLIAQALLFLLAGFDTTTTLMQATCFELAMNPEMQQTLIEEVDEMLIKLNGETISYDHLNSMKFLEMIINESLRKWPSFRVIIRQCNADCLLEDDETGKTFKIKEGTRVWIPINAIQMDPKYFSNPEKFDPYRFSDENKSNIQTGTFIPFGMGPRTCIGSRYALIEAKLLVFTIMSNFKIEKSSRTPEKLSFSKGITGFNETIYVKLMLRQ